MRPTPEAVKQFQLLPNFECWKKSICESGIYYWHVIREGLMVHEDVDGGIEWTVLFQDHHYEVFPNLQEAIKGGNALHERLKKEAT